MKASAIIVIVAVVIGSFFAFTDVIPGLRGERGNGNVVTEKRDISNITAVQVQNGLDLHIKQGSSELLEVKADENLQPLIKTEVSKGVLKIYTDERISRSKALDVYLTVVDLKRIAASGGSDIDSHGLVKFSELDISSSGGSDVALNIESNSLSISSSGGSDVELKGGVGSMTISISGGSDVDACELITGKCNVSASGGSDAELNVTEELSVMASGGSDVSVIGNPKIGNKQLSGSSDLHIK